MQQLNDNLSKKEENSKILEDLDDESGQRNAKDMGETHNKMMKESKKRIERSTQPKNEE